MRSQGYHQARYQYNSMKAKFRQSLNGTCFGERHTIPWPILENNKSAMKYEVEVSVEILATKVE